ncbi:MAG: hypothetical protein P1V97_11275 [Planctomycetota bacterium]|nr:hypothetical protein [Planctomycetota bacterium]
MDIETVTYNLLMVAGLSQIALIIGSLAIPKVLGWGEDLKDLKTLLRQMFWTYAGYIWATNLSFGLISLFGPHLLLDHSPLAACVCGFMFLYWFSRVVIQWTYFDISDLPKGLFHTIAKWLLEILFVALTVVYGAALYINLQAISGQ